MKKKILIAALFLFLSHSVFAIDESVKISLKEALNLALTTNPQVKVAKLSVIQAKNDIKIANKLQNPSLDSFFNIGESGKDNPQQIGVDYVVEILKRGRRKSTAASIHASAEQSEKFLEQKLILDVKLAYFDVLLKKSNLKIIEEQKEISQQILTYTKEAYKNNKLPKTDYIQAKIEYNRVIMYSNIAKSELVYSKNRFNAVINSNETDFDTLEDDLSSNYAELLTTNPENIFYDFQKIKIFALKNRHDLKSGMKDIETAQNKLKEVKSKLMPDLVLKGGYAFQPKSISYDNVYKSGAYAGVGLDNIPLVYHYQPEIKNAKLEIEKAKLKYDDMRIDAVRNITDSWEKYEIARNNLNFYNNELLTNSKELLDESFNNLNERKIDLTSFYVSKKLYLDLTLGYKQALNEYYISFAELLKELNVENFDEVL